MKKTFDLLTLIAIILIGFIAKFASQDLAAINCFLAAAIIIVLYKK